MRFVIKAIFFLAVVASFIPRGSGGTSSPEAEPALEIRDIASGELCERQPSVCAAAQESAIAAKVIGKMAFEQARLAISQAEWTASEPVEADAQPETTLTP